MPWKALSLCCAISFIVGIIVQREFSWDVTNVLIYIAGVVVAAAGGALGYDSLAKPAK